MNLPEKIEDELRSLLDLQEIPKFFILNLIQKYNGRIIAPSATPLFERYLKDLVLGKGTSVVGLNKIAIATIDWFDLKERNE
jgi:hypothetical protein